jgi:hypothetical protein
MATTNQFKINGLIDTGNNVLDNLNSLANVSGCYLTWDPSLGKWIVILNAVSTSTKNFNDSNIIGEINVGGTGVNQLYNSVIATFPNKDTRDTTDQIQLTVPTANRFAQELDNVLNLEIPIVNDPVQAAYIASRELKQSRLDTIIEFRSNFEANTVRAGDVVDITNIPLGYTGKLFRVIQIEEEDEDDGSLIFSITAQEYDPNVYDPNSGINNASGGIGLTYEYRSNFTGIKSKLLSEELDKLDDVSAGSQMGRLLAANAALGLINSLFSVDPETGAIINEGKFADPNIQNLISSVNAPPAVITRSLDEVCSGAPVTFTIGHNCSSCFFISPQFTYNYTITGVTAEEIDVPLTGTITTSGTTKVSLVVTASVTTSKTMIITVGGTSQSVSIQPAPGSYVFNVTASPTSITEGTSTTVSVSTVGYANGTTLNYTISGTATSKVTSPALTGTVTVNGNSASLNIVTADDSVWSTSRSLTVTVGTLLTSPCFIADNTADITVNNNFTTGPAPPTYGTILSSVCDGTTLVETVANGTGGSFIRNTANSLSCGYVAPVTRQYVSTPFIWTGSYDGTTGNLLSVSVQSYAYMPVPFAGEPTAEVPLTLSVTSGSSSTITIVTTRTISTVAGLGGTLLEPIIAFNAVGQLSAITGTRAAIYGDS